MKIAVLAAVVGGVSLLCAPTAFADPMKCSGEQKICAADCAKQANGGSLSACLTSCGQRLSLCVKTGCWDNGKQRYCGLSRQ